MNKPVRDVEYKGETKYLVDWAKELGISYEVLRKRIYDRNWPVERAFTTPAKKLVKLDREKATEIRSLLAAVRKGIHIVDCIGKI